jgi:hypothetical protein
MTIAGSRLPYAAVEQVSRCATIYRCAADPPEMESVFAALTAQNEQLLAIIFTEDAVHAARGAWTAIKQAAARLPHPPKLVGVRSDKNCENSRSVLWLAGATHVCAPEDWPALVERLATGTPPCRAA